jgi:hypothetical protein
VDGTGSGSCQIGGFGDRGFGEVILFFSGRSGARLLCRPISHATAKYYALELHCVIRFQETYFNMNEIVPLLRMEYDADANVDFNMRAQASDSDIIIIIVISK